MAGPYLRKYGVAATVNFELFEVDGVDFRIDAVHAAGDTKIMKDEGVEANTTNGFVDEGQGYSLALTATEMQAARIVVYVVDQTATKVWLDRTIIIETYGNASAQHAFDLDDAQQSVDIAAGGIAASAFAAGAIDAAAIAANAIGASELAADAVSEIADQVWDEAKAGHVAAGSFGEEVQAHALSTEITALNDLSAAEVNAEVDAALNTPIPGTPTADSVNERIAAIDDLTQAAGGGDLAAILADTNELQTDDVPGLIAALNNLSAAEVQTEVESALEDAGLVAVITTIATLTSQTSFTLTAGSADDDAYNGCIAVIEDAATAVQKAIGIVSDYVGLSKTVTLAVDPGIFTMAAADKIAILPPSGVLGWLTAKVNALVSGRVDVDVGAKTGNVALSTQEKLDVNQEVDSALDTAVPASPTANSINERVKTFDDADVPARLPTTLVGGRMDSDIGAKTGNVALSAQEKLDVNAEVDSAFTTQMPDSISADGTIATREQALYMILQMLTEFGITGTTLTVKKVDGATTLMTFTLDDATNPTSLTRAT